MTQFLSWSNRPQYPTHSLATENVHPNDQKVPYRMIANRDFKVIGATIDDDLYKPLSSVSGAPSGPQKFQNSIPQLVVTLSTFFVPDVHIPHNNHESSNKTLQEYSDSLNWLATQTKPNLSTITYIISQYNNKFSPGHIYASK
jgi:hypothetical protein